MTTSNQLWRNRKDKNDWTRRLRSEDPGLGVVHPHAAGIDVGNTARIRLPCGQTEIQKRYAGLSVLWQACTVWRNG